MGKKESAEFQKTFITLAGVVDRMKPARLYLRRAGMGYVDGESRDQAILFPAVMDDYVAENSLVRFIEAFVKSLDLEKLGFDKSVPAMTGRPAYDPGDLLGLYLYGYVNGIRSSRKLAREAGRNLELIWLLRRLSPDFRTISDFRKNNLEPIKKVFREFLDFCKELKLFGGKLIGIDGSKFKASNGKKNNYTEGRLKELIPEIEKRIEKYLKRLEESDNEEAGVREPTKEELKEKIEAMRERKKKYEEIREEMKKANETQKSLVDPESRLMKTNNGGANVCYNVETGVDSEHKLIVAYEVTNAVNDYGQLCGVGEQAKEVLGVEELEVTADGGFYDAADIKKCEEAGITVYVPKPPASKNNGRFTKDDFKYQADRDVYICPAGKELVNKGLMKSKGEKRVFYYATEACGSCPMLKQCTKGKARRIKRRPDEDVLERMAKRVKENPEKMKARKELVEHPFGTMKMWMGFGHFLLRTKKKVSAEMGLMALAYNLRRVIGIVGVEKMIEVLG